MGSGRPLAVVGVGDRAGEVARNRAIMGEVLWVRIADEFVDAERIHVHADRLRLLARMHGAGWYARTSDPVPDAADDGGGVNRVVAPERGGAGE